MRRRALPDPDRLAFHAAARIAADLCRVELDDVLRRGSLGTNRKRRIRTARMIALYLANTAANVPIGRLARASGRSKQRTSDLCHRAEDLRDDPRFDALLTRAEAWFLLVHVSPPAREPRPAVLRKAIAAATAFLEDAVPA